MNKRLELAYEEMKELDTLNRTLRLMYENPDNEDYAKTVDCNLTTMIHSVDALNLNDECNPTIRFKLSNTLKLLRKLKSNNSYSNEAQLNLGIKLIEIYLNNNEAKEHEQRNIIEHSEELTVYGDRTTPNVYQLRAIRGSGSRRDYGVFKIGENGIIQKVEEFYTRQKAEDWIWYRIGYRERLDELSHNPNALIYRDESKEKNMNNHRRCGRDDAERFMFSEKRVDRNLEDTETKLNRVIAGMIEERKLLTKSQIEAIINEGKGKDDMMELKQVLLTKAEEDTDYLEKLLGLASSSVIVKGRKSFEA